VRSDKDKDMEEDSEEEIGDLDLASYSHKEIMIKYRLFTFSLFLKL
jgi:hypothetical protein